MAFTLSDEQNNKLKYIQKYSAALKNIRETYLVSLKNCELSTEEREQIWSASFTLQYMCQLHAEYEQLLRVLALDDQSRAVLAELLNKLTDNPVAQLNEFIQHFHEISKSEDFDKKLKSLSSHYKQWALIMGSIPIIAFIGAIGIGIGVSVGLIIIPVLVPALMLALIIISSFIGAIILASAETARLYFHNKRDAIDDTISSLRLSEAQSFNCVDKYDYDATENGETKKVSLLKSNSSELTNILRDRFFTKTFLNHTSTLSQEVQVECNQLMTVVI